MQAYANYFRKFIDAYKEQGVNIDMVIYQNEGHTATRLTPVVHGRPRERCGSIVTIWVPRSDKTSGGEALSRDVQHQPCGLRAEDCFRHEAAGIRKRHGIPMGRPRVAPRTAQGTSLSGTICVRKANADGAALTGGAGEHTFELMNHYLGNGCNEYTFWNFILADNGESPWGWKQNALIRVDSKARTFTYTPEYFCREALQPFHHERQSGGGLQSPRGRQDAGIGQPHA